jgi:hypothetical protein
MAHPDVPERIHAFDPDIDLIFMLRNPVERAYSHYCMLLRAGKVSDSPDKELRPGTRLVDDGLYMKHLERFLEFFDTAQIHVYLVQDLKKSSKAFLTSVFQTLNVDPDVETELSDERYHAKRPRPRFSALFECLTDIASKASKYSLGLQQLIRRIRRSSIVDWFHYFNQGPEYPALPESTERWLQDYYSDDVARLSKFLERDLKRLWTS